MFQGEVNHYFSPVPIPHVHTIHNINKKNNMGEFFKNGHNRAVLVDLEPGTMDSVRSGPYGQVQLD